MKDYLKNVKDLVLSELKNEEMKIFVFGSRARGDFRSGSDVDIGFIPQGSFDVKKISFLKEKLEDSSQIPYKVDIVNFNEVSDEFRDHALKETILWKN